MFFGVPRASLTRRCARRFLPAESRRQLEQSSRSGPGLASRLTRTAISLGGPSSVGRDTSLRFVGLPCVEDFALWEEASRCGPCFGVAADEDSHLASRAVFRRPENLAPIR